MCIMCVAIPFVLVTIAPRCISATRGEFILPIGSYTWANLGMAYN